MNTPAHAVFNLVLLGRKRRPARTSAIFWGAILPDIPMFWFYFYEKIVAGMPEREIWGRLYFDPRWQALFDAFHSLPVVGLGYLLCRRFRAPRLAALFASMALHSVCDLVLHHDDAHRHLFPLLDWRFLSPLSYWDPRYHGRLIGIMEAVGVGVGLVLLLRRHTARSTRVLLSILLGLYVALLSFALWFWIF